MTKLNNKHSIRGFSLVELSIVIVIIGLVIAGVTAGSSLVRNYNLRRIVTDLNNLQTAANTFKIQYSQLPGDFNNAYAYWGSSCAASASLCNGNGNGLIITPYQEEFKSFTHLSLAKLIPGSYNGTISWANIGVNVPSGPLSKSGYTFAAATDSDYYWGNFYVDIPGSYQQNKGNFIWFGGADPAGYNILAYKILTTKEMYSIDSKADDGLPHSGKILQSNRNTGCTVGLNAPTTYDLNATGIRCAIKYRL